MMDSDDSTAISLGDLPNPLTVVVEFQRGEIFRRVCGLDMALPCRTP